jgi:hypothetical protein
MFVLGGFMGDERVLKLSTTQGTWSEVVPMPEE